MGSVGMPLGSIGAVIAARKGGWKGEVDELTKAFQKADLNKNGKLSVSEYRNILKERGIITNKKQIEKLFAAADSDGDGLMSKEEFRAELGRIDRANRAYDLFDGDRDGGVSVAELTRSTALENKEARLAVSRADKDKDSKISRSEFHGMINRKRLRSSGRSVPGEKAFDALDVNKDGVVTVDEIAKGTDLKKDTVLLSMRNVDKNKDGKLNK